MTGDLILCLGALLAPLLFGAFFVIFIRARTRRHAHPTHSDGEQNDRAGKSDLKKSMRWPDLLVGNTLCLLLLLSICFLAGETYVRFFYDKSDSFAVTRTSVRWFQRHYHLNQNGVRDNVDYAPHVSSGMRRITFLGDSFTAGHGIADVDDRFANRIRVMKKGTWEVNVMAQNGLDTGEELDYFGELLASDYQMDVLVLVYCLNDITDIIPEWNRIALRIKKPRRGDDYLVRHSYLVNLLFYRMTSFRDPDVANYYGFVRAAYESGLFDTQKQRLRTLADRCKANGIQLIVVTLPFMHQLGKKYDYRDAHKKLAEIWRELNVPHLDLLEIYEGENPNKLTVHKFDAHPNERAHQLAAGPIARFIEDNIEPKPYLEPKRGD